MANYLRVALLFRTRLEEDTKVLNAISKYNRFHEQWSAFVDDEIIGSKNPDWILSKRWDGIICKYSSEELLTKCLSKGIPCIDLTDNRKQVSGIPKIRPDNFAVGHKGAEHFLERGFRHFAFVGFKGEQWSEERRDGFEEALSLLNHSCHFFDSGYPNINTPDWDAKEEEALNQWLKTLPTPIGIMACNDLRALHIINACREGSLQIPEEIAILGANNESIRCELTNPQLSSVPLNAELYGQTAAKILSQMMAGKPAPTDPVLIDPDEVVTRRSTNILAIEDKHVSRALNFIRENATKGISVNEIVSKVHVSRSILERRFRKFLGRSPQAEIRNFQVQKIKQYLAETDYTLAQIAEATGFEHPEYMCVVFKRITKLTPKQYRQKFVIPD